MRRRPNPSRSGNPTCAPICTSCPNAARTVARIVAGSPAWKPQAMLAEVMKGISASSSPSFQRPKLSPMSTLTSSIVTDAIAPPPGSAVLTHWLPVVAAAYAGSGHGDDRLARPEGHHRSRRCGSGDRRDRLGELLGRLVGDEVPDARQLDVAGAGDQLGEPAAVADRREPVLGAVDDHRRHGEAGEPPGPAPTRPPAHPV